MDPNVNFRLFELKKDEYEKAIIDGEWNGQKKDFTNPNLMDIDTTKKYSYTDILSNMGQTITFKNPRITVVPTGLRGDLTPYLFSLFGFTLMAGAYFVINKRKEGRFKPIFSEQEMQISKCITPIKDVTNVIFFQNKN